MNFHLSVNTNHHGPVSLKLTYLLRSVLAGQQNVSGLVSDEDRCHITAMENFLTFCHPSVCALLAVFICTDSQGCAAQYLGKGQTKSLICAIIVVDNSFIGYKWMRE